MVESEVLESIRIRLTRNVGQVITSELARGLFESIAEEVRQIRPAPQWLANFVFSMQPVTSGEYVLTHRLSMNLARERGIDRLHQLHWEETEKHRNHVELKPDYDAMQRAIEEGRAKLFTAHVGGRLVANFFCYLFRSTHTGEVIATEDTLFVEREHRKKVSDVFIRYVIDTLRDADVAELRISTKVTNRAGELFRRRYKFQHVANEYVLRLKE